MATSDGSAEGEPRTGPLGVDDPVASWLLGTFRSLGRRGLIAVAVVYGAVPFVVGFGVAVHAGFEMEFLRTGSVYLWTAGLFGGALTFGWWAKRYPRLWTELDPVFDVPGDEYRATVRGRVDRMYDLTRVVLWFPVVFVVAAVYDVVLEGVTVLIYVPAAPAVDESICLPAVPCFDWLGVINYAFGVVSLVGVLIAVHVLIQHLRLVDDVMELPLRDVETAAADLAPLARFNTLLSVGWFATLTLGLLLLITGPQEAWRDPFLTAGLLFVTLLGFVLFAVPQVSIHDGLLSAKRSELNEVDAEYEQLYAEATSAGNADSLEEVATQLDVLEARRRNVKEIPTWAYDLPGSISLLISSVIPLGLQVVRLFT